MVHKFMGCMERYCFNEVAMLVSFLKYSLPPRAKQRTERMLEELVVVQGFREESSPVKAFGLN